MRSLLAALLAALAGCGGDGGRAESVSCRCPAGQECVEGRCAGGAAEFVEPAAAPVACPPPEQFAGGVVGPAAAPTACAPTVQASDAPAGWAASLGVHRVGTELRVPVPPAAASLTIVLQAANVSVTTITARASGSGSPFTFRNTAVPLVVRAPDGEPWFDDTADPLPDPSGQLAFFASDSPTVGTLTIPNTTRALEQSAAGLPGGEWTFTVSDYAFECASVEAYADLCRPAADSADEASFLASEYDVTVIAKPGPRRQQGTLDVALYLQRCPGGDYADDGSCLAPPLQSSSALGDRDAQRMLQSLGQVMAAGGVCLGKVTWYDLPDWAQQRWAEGLDLDPASCEGGLNELLKLSHPGTEGGSRMNLFLVPDIVLRRGGGQPTRVVGVDGTIPGPASVAGTPQSGAAVSTANLRERAASCSGELRTDCGADVTAYIAAHEAGHFLGLYHVTERDGASFDPLADTPQCVCEQCVAASLVPQCGTARSSVDGPSCTQGEESCSGGRNLMFWLLHQGSQGRLSPQQAEVVRANPLVH